MLAWFDTLTCSNFKLPRHPGAEDGIPRDQYKLHLYRRQFLQHQTLEHKSISPSDSMFFFFPYREVDKGRRDNSSL